MPAKFWHLARTQGRETGDSRPFFFFFFFPRHLSEGEGRMSMSHRPGTSARQLAADLLNIKWVSRHRGDRHDFLNRHRRQAKKFLELGRVDIEKIARSLLHRISDERTLRVAWEYLSEHGGQAPGPDGLCYDDVPAPWLSQECRELRDEIRSGRYELSDEAVHWVSKGSGRGSRPLILQSILDRVVQRACVEILQPLLDPKFDRRSFGYRPGKSPQHALAAADRLARSDGRWVWAAVDLRDAFSRVPLERLLDIVQHYLPSEELVVFLRRILSGARMPGLRQGGPLSPLLLNLFLHHLLDNPWRKQHPDIPLIRYADDILLLCRSVEEAGEAYDRLKELLRPTGMQLKETRQQAVRDLGAGAAVNYMGTRIRKTDNGNGLRFDLTRGAWDGLAESLARAQEEPHAPVRAVLALTGWVAARGPCYPDLKHEQVYARIESVARKAGFDEIPGAGKIKGLWQRAYARWGRLQKSTKDG
jgi:retron-type reverse transcriptase